MITPRAPASIPSSQARDLASLGTLPDNKHSVAIPDSECPPHHWLIPTPDGSSHLEARCKLCGAERTYKSSREWGMLVGSEKDTAYAVARQLAKAKRPVLEHRAKRPRSARATHCRRGHEFTKENTRVNTRGWQACRTCLRATHRQYRQRRREMRPLP